MSRFFQVVIIGLLLLLAAGMHVSADGAKTQDPALQLTCYEREHLRLMTEQNRLLRDRNNLIERKIRACR